MKRISMLVLLLLTFMAANSEAQNHIVAPIGVVDGTLHYPHSTLVVDLTLAEEQVVAGPYARYALKFLGLRAPLADKKSYTLRSANLALQGDAELTAAATPAKESALLDYSHSSEGFPMLTADRTELIQPTAESAAQQAASRIFQLRRSRLDLITGEAGEHVFGEGLKVALEEIDRQEQALLELFLGKQTTRLVTHRLEVAPKGDTRQYILCRFSAADGLLDATDLSGDIVLLEIIPGEPYPVEGVSAKSKIRYRVAAPARCEVKCLGELLGGRTLPLFEFGLTLPVVQ